ncbi:hypothetical protein LTR53_000092 [Teratosphaeriaceae sp. CCFEE 6253]|nr:hypothetical protein LTR53_000092 [Teratosphaeriaceae sp. CCFEE 6253]
MSLVKENEAGLLDDAREMNNFPEVDEVVSREEAKTLSLVQPREMREMDGFLNHEEDRATDKRKLVAEDLVRIHTGAQ